tara:strand:- start:1219 stop:2022 length:804 start_codon:yes stop_codon:yes gene_type:complete
VKTVSDWLYAENGNIIDSDQFGDPNSETFFMRVHFSLREEATTVARLRSSFAVVAEEHQMSWQLWPADEKPKVLIMVSRMDHCLVDLLYRTRIGELPVEISLIASNHRDAYPLAAAQDIDFLHLPVTPETKVEQESRLVDEIRSRNINLVVLARYMQVLTGEFCAHMPGQIINIHHSFLPSFKGAKPYHQAFDRGVKLIGATAHYVTEHLDEGPIIEQAVERVDHRMTTKQLSAVGRDVERIVLARAVRYHAERRVLINGQRTVVFQ